jgi:hypothetical protein
VLVGYSQGAWAIGDAIVRMTTAERDSVRGVVLFGNPKYNPITNGAAGPDYRQPGIVGGRGTYPDGVANRTSDYCTFDDLICNRLGFSEAAHKSYDRDYVAHGVNALAVRLGLPGLPSNVA